MILAPEFRRRVRAVGIAILLVTQGMVALPLPRSVKRSDFDQPVAREEMGRWVEVLGSVGVHTTHDALADAFTEYGSAFGGVRKDVLLPLKPFLRLTGTGQSWGLFTYPDTFPHKLVIEARTGARWDTLYGGLDPDHTFLRNILVYRRVRGVYDGNSGKPGPSWENFTQWVARQAFAAFPDVEEVRVRFLRFHTVPPGGAADTEVVPRHARTILRP